MTIESNNKEILRLCENFNSTRLFPNLFLDAIKNLSKTPEQLKLEEEKIREGQRSLAETYLASIRAGFHYPSSSASTESSSNKMSPSS